MITVRKYRPSDQSAVEHICVATATGIFSTALMRRPVLNIYCRYYLEREPGSCFVACGEDDTPIGYILCAESCDSWCGAFRADYIRKMRNPFGRAAAEASLKIPKKYAENYPAHLHIDILPEYHRMGIGTRLFRALREQLIADGVPGVMLTAGADNETAISFYQSLGFQLLEKNRVDAVMGMRLENTDTV